MVVKHLTLVPKKFGEIRVNQTFMDNKEQILTKITNSTAAMMDHGASLVVEPFSEAEFYVIEKINLTNSEHAAYLDGVYETLEVVKGRYSDTFKPDDGLAIYKMMSEAYSADSVVRRHNVDKLAKGNADIQLGDVVEISTRSGFTQSIKRLWVTHIIPDERIEGVVLEASYPGGATPGEMALLGVGHKIITVVDHIDSLDISDLIDDNEEEE